MSSPPTGPFSGKALLAALARQRATEEWVEYRPDPSDDESVTRQGDWTVIRPTRRGVAE